MEQGWKTSEIDNMDMAHFMELMSRTEEKQEEKRLEDLEKFFNSI